MTRISVALAVYNGERFLAEQLRSILAQTVVPDELVIVDDASTDGSAAVIAGALTGASIDVVRIENPTNAGVATSFATAVAACTGDLIVLCDQDDVWHPQRVELMAQAFAGRSELTMLHSDARLVDDAGNPLGSTLFGMLGVTARDRAAIHAGRGLDVLLTRNLVTGATAAFRSSLVDAALPVPSAWIHDEWLAAIAASVGRLDLLENLLIDYRQHSANVIGVEALGLRGKFARLTEARGDRNVQLALRAAQLVERLERLAPGSEALTAARAKADHEQRRATLPRNRVKRVPSVLAGALTGRYGRYSRGVIDVARDLIQPS